MNIKDLEKQWEDGIAKSITFIVTNDLIQIYFTRF